VPDVELKNISLEDEKKDEIINIKESDLDGHLEVEDPSKLSSKEILNEVLPMMIARLWSCNAPETISEAEAEPSLIKTTIGAPFNTSPGSALNLMLLFFKRLVDENKGDLKSLILDLRNNPGGILDGAVDISNLFLDDA
jgi:hypothetical protein